MSSVPYNNQVGVDHAVAATKRYDNLPHRSDDWSRDNVDCNTGCGHEWNYRGAELGSLAELVRRWNRSECDVA